VESLYLTSAVSTNQFPTGGLSEAVFVGRSNCGKSSLLNGILQRKNLARTSSTPGRTAMINFFSIKLAANKEYILADLPGYGFSKTGKHLQKEWGSIITAYLQRPVISNVLFLVDIRRQLEEVELDYLQDLAHTKHSLILVLTKADKVSRQEAQAKKKQAQASLAALAMDKEPVVLVTSVLKKQGLDSIRKEIFS
jgi:GTP-binding protein